MATITPTPLSLPEPGNPPAWSYQWGPMQLNDVGGALPDVWSFADRSVQVEGTFGSGGTCSVEGSNDGATYRTLNDVFGNALSMTAAGIKEINEVTRYLRPHITAGDGSTSLTVTMFLRRTTPHI